MTGSYHIGLGPEHLAGNGDLGRYVFLPGDRSRAERIAACWEVTDVVRSPRGHDAHLGVLRDPRGDVEVMAISSGMGTPSVEIVLHELLEIGARRIVRVGSSGPLTSAVPAGAVVIASGAVRDESTTDRWTPRGYPAVSHPDAVAAMRAGAVAAGLADSTFVGLCHSKDSFFAREFGHGPRAEENERYMAQLGPSGVLATEMEASLLFVMAAVRTGARATSIAAGPSAVAVQAACVLGAYGEPGSTVTRLADERAVTVAVAGVAEWAAGDR